MKKIVNGLIGITILAGVGVFGLKDMVIQKVLEKQMTEALESNVRIYGVDYFIFKEKLELKGIGIESKEDESIDAIYINRVSTNIKLQQIFDKKIGLENLEIRDIELNKKTDRKNTKPVVRKVETELTNKKISPEEMQKLTESFLVNYQHLLTKLKSDNSEKNARLKALFINATVPALDKFIDYKLSDVASSYMIDIIDKYNTLKTNFQESKDSLEEDAWVVEISDLLVKTSLLGRNFEGVVKGITTDKTKMNKNIPFSLVASNQDEKSSITGYLNIGAFTGEIDSKFENIDVNNFMTEKDLIEAKANLVQKISLDEEKISIIGRLDMKELDINKEKVSDYFLKDKDALDIIVGDTNDKIKNLKVEYNYNPSFNRVFVNSNIAKEVASYLGGNDRQLDKLKEDFNNKYGEKINKTKEELKYKLEEFINVFNKN